MELTFIYSQYMELEKASKKVLAVQGKIERLKKDCSGYDGPTRQAIDEEVESLKIKRDSLNNEIELRIKSIRNTQKLTFQ